MKNKDFSNIEDQIKDAVQDALESMDFGSLNSKISGSINGALDEVKKQFKSAEKQVDSVIKSSRDKLVDAPNKGGKPQYEPSPQQHNKPSKPAKEQEAYHTQNGKAEPHPYSKAFNSKIRTIGKIAALLSTIFGIFMTVCAIAGAIVITVAMFMMDSLSASTIAILIIPLLVFGAGLLLYRRAHMLRSRNKRLMRYAKILNGKTYCSIKELSDFSGKSEAYVKKDLQKMIKLGMIPEGHLDRESTCLMIDDQTYAQYMETQKAMDQRMAQEKLQQERIDQEQDEEQVKAEKEKKTAYTAAKGKAAPGSDEEKLAHMIEEGHTYIKELRIINDAIPGEVISAKLYRLETITGKIFDTVGRQPRQMPQMQKFMDYYLPTTLKLLTAYQEFDSVDLQGDNIKGAKEEIEKTLDTINLAFEKLLDDLYQDAVFDVTTDASVLQTMLAREGLTESDFKEEGKP